MIIWYTCSGQGRNFAKVHSTVRIRTQTPKKLDGFYFALGKPNLEFILYMYLLKTSDLVNEHLSHDFVKISTQLAHALNILS